MEQYQDIVRIIKGGLFVVERREAHALEVPAIPLFAPHHDPHGAPLRNVHGLYHKRNLIHKADGSRDVVQHIHLLHLCASNPSLSSRPLCSTVNAPTFDC